MPFHGCGVTAKLQNPKSIVGKNIEVDGVNGKWLDVLLVVKDGETLECEARHDGGSRLTFPGELLRKVAAYDPKDYPVLPEGFRGIQWSPWRRRSSRKMARCLS